MVGNARNKPTRCHHGLLIPGWQTPPLATPPTLSYEQDISEWDNAKSEFFDNLCKFNGNFRLLLRVEMSSNYLSKFHIIFNKSALLLQLMNWKAWILCALCILWNVSKSPSLENLFVQRERTGEEAKRFHRLLCLIHPTPCAGLPSGLRQCHRASVGVPIWSDRELPGAGWTSLASPEEYILIRGRDNVNARRECLCKAVFSKCSLLGGTSPGEYRHHLGISSMQNTS